MLLDDCAFKIYEDREALAAIERKSAHIITTGNGPTFQQLLDACPEALASSVDCHTGCIRIGEPEDISDTQRMLLRKNLLQLAPWRKGPFQLFGLDIDCEWRSDWKWERLAQHISSLEGKRILDIGSSNGYYLMRMAAEKPQVALGVEPFLKHHFQFMALQRYAQIPHIHSLPIRLEDLPPLTSYFDTLFCMGILYHRRSPLDFLVQMRDYLRPGGELVLETLTIDGADDTVLCPPTRYAKMHNCFFLPTDTCLQHWLERCKFKNVRIVDVSVTSAEEQRNTEWVQSESLTDFLDDNDPTRTIEGLPAPRRTLIIANT